MTKYIPNFNDPRVVKRINRSLDYAFANLSETKPKQWSTRHIDKWFGNQGNNLSRMLRQQLLIVADPYYNPLTKTAKKYLLNLDAAINLANKVNRQIIPSALHIQQEKINSADRIFGNEIAQGEFVYKSKSNRLWHDCQNIDNTTRKQLFANYGYVHEYDIKSAAPTLLYQLSRACGLTRSTPTIQQYLTDPEYYRNKLAHDLEVDRKTAKTLITSRFAGARLGTQNSLMQQLNNNRIRYERLKNNEWFDSLTKDIKKMWDAIKLHESTGRLSVRDKWSIYYREELRVMRLVHKFLEQQGISKSFHEHDGWRSCSAIDIRQLKLSIHKASGYWIDFDYEVFDK